MGSSNLPSTSLSHSRDFEQKKNGCNPRFSPGRCFSCHCQAPGWFWIPLIVQCAASGQRVPNTCSTLSGSTCIFPFVYNGATHFQCTYTDSPTPWCATAVDSNNEVVTNGWGDCAV